MNDLRQKPLKLLAQAALAQLAFACCAVRHQFFWGGDWAEWLHALEALGLVSGAAIGAIACARIVRIAPQLDEKPLLLGGILLAVIAALAPPFLSNDIWDYVARGRVEVLGHNPYITTVDTLASDPAMRPFADRANWTDWAMPYGPVSALLQHVCALTDSPWVGAYLWKAMATAAHLAAGAALAATSRAVADTAAGRRMLALWLWNPWTLLECCGSGHNDVIAILGLAMAGMFVARLRFAPAAIAYGAGMLAKHCSPAFAPLLLISAWRNGRLTAFALGTFAVAAALTIAYFRWWNIDGGLDWIANQAGVARGSLPSFVGAALGPTAGSAVMVAGLALTATVLLLAMRKAHDARSLGGHATVATILLMLLAMPNFAPWYCLWWLPFGALAQHKAIDRALLALALLGPASYAVLVATREFGPVHEAWAWITAALIPAAIVLQKRRDLLA
jgi:hypothetical protein